MVFEKLQLSWNAVRPQLAEKSGTAKQSTVPTAALATSIATTIGARRISIFGDAVTWGLGRWYCLRRSWKGIAGNAGKQTKPLSSHGTAPKQDNRRNQTCDWEAAVWIPCQEYQFCQRFRIFEFWKLEENLHTLVYFAEPHKPWQRGTNESTNDTVRFFFPKGFDFRTVTDKEIHFASLYATFPPQNARNLAERLEIHYTPKHGSWLDIAEIELSALGRQCIANYRIPNLSTLRSLLAPWTSSKNTA